MSFLKFERNESWFFSPFSFTKHAEQRRQGSAEVGPSLSVTQSLEPWVSITLWGDSSSDSHSHSRHSNRAAGSSRRGLGGGQQLCSLWALVNRAVVSIAIVVACVSAHAARQLGCDSSSRCDLKMTRGATLTETEEEVTENVGLREEPKCRTLFSPPRTLLAAKTVNLPGSAR